MYAAKAQQNQIQNSKIKKFTQSHLLKKLVLVIVMMRQCLSLLHWCFVSVVDSVELLQHTYLLLLVLYQCSSYIGFVYYRTSSKPDKVKKNVRCDIDGYTHLKASLREKVKISHFFNFICSVK